MSKAILELKNISKHYNQGKTVIEVLSSINLSVGENELIAIVGSSGSGKSTLLHIAGLLDSPHNGEIYIDSQKCHANNSNLIRLYKIGYIYQQHHLLKDFTALENVVMPRLIMGSNYKTALEEGEQLLVDLGLKDRIRNMPGEMSGGEQQRVAVARALINSPKIILADEPTGNLDPKNAEEVFNLFLKTASQKNSSVIMVTHNYYFAQKMHKLYELKYGQLLLAE